MGLAHLLHDLRACGVAAISLGCVLGDESTLEPVKLFGAVRGYASRASASRNAETVPAAVRTVKLPTSYFLGGENSVPVRGAPS